jgi:hypothetical protein
VLVINPVIFAAVSSGFKTVAPPCQSRDPFRREVD